MSTPFLNPFEEIHRHRHHLPHWQQGEAWQFVTWRLADSIPKTELDQWAAQKAVWLELHPEPWDEVTELDYHRQFSRRMDEWLDAGHGSCALCDPDCASIVAAALLHFDSQRYRLGPLVVMPNHVHVLFQPLAGWRLDQVVHSWKSYTAKEINKRLNRFGALWQEDYWDQIIRREQHWQACRRYILLNPAKLPPQTYILQDRELASSG
ncbi:MAG: hypothetical protein FJ387_15015 [Verrucomicrobia bacterium]|nr:hypothetical protein [Verrucomicrobiota bacterium]